MRKVWRVLLIVLSICMLTGCGALDYRSGVRNLEKGHYDIAEKKFKSAIKAEKNVADSYRGLGLSQYEQENYKDAITNLEEAMAQGSEPNATIYNVLGACAMNLEKYADAAKYYELGISQKDAQGEMKQQMMFNIVLAYEKADDLASARDAINAYVSQYPDDEAAAKEAEFLATR